MSNFHANDFHTTELTLHVMETCAFLCGLDIADDAVSNELYWICCDLESWGEDEGFGSSDSYSYVKATRRFFNMPEPMPTN